MNAESTLFPFVAILVIVVAALVAGVRARRTVITAYEWDHTALVVDGRFLRWLEPGRHTLWSPAVRALTVDRRALALTVPMQEILTADGASVRISLSATYRVTEPARYLLERASAATELYDALQLALRRVVGERTLEAVAASRGELSAAVLAAAREGIGELGVELDRLDVRDFAVLGELRKSVAAVLQARLEGQAALEKARAETAALRSLANAARMMDENPNLLNLRLLQTIQGNRQASVVFDPRLASPGTGRSGEDPGAVATGRE